jgi:hypothetical protein
MSTLSWKLSTNPAQAPEYWLLFVDSNACTALVNQAPYVGPGDYSVDLTKLDTGSPVPTDGAAHTYSVALVGNGTIGPQSAAVLITLPAPVLVATAGAIASGVQQEAPDVWPTADTLALT